MIHFICPGCDTVHKAHDSFAGKRAKCVRCGATLHIPADDGPAHQAPMAGLPDDDISIDDYAEQWAAEQAAAEAADPPPEPPEPPEEPPEHPPRWAAWGALAGVVVALALGGGVWYAVANRTPAVASKKAAPPPTEEEPPAPAAPTPPAAVLVSTPAPPPPPEPPPVRVTASRLAHDRRRDPRGWAAAYAGKRLELVGVGQAFRAGVLTFDDTRPDQGEDATAAVAVTLPAYQPRFGGDAELAAVVLGPAGVPAATPLAAGPAPGRPVRVVGRCAADGTLGPFALAGTSAPADAAYLGRVLCLRGTVAQAADASAGVLTLEADRTDAVVAVACHFRGSAAAAVRALRPGDPVLVTGRCSGRHRRTVRLEDCAAADPATAPPAIPADELAARYEADLRVFPPVNNDVPPVAVTADALAAAVAADPLAAEARYGHRPLRVTGTALRVEPGRRAVAFETGTDTPVRVSAVFTAANFRAVRPDETTVTLDAVFRGSPPGGPVQLESAAVIPPDPADLTTRRLSAADLPLPVGREWTAVAVQYPPPVAAAPRSAAKPKPPAHPAVRTVYRVVSDGLVRSAPVQLGTFAGPSLAAAGTEPKWQGKPLPVPRGPFTDVRFRVTAKGVETAAATPGEAWETTLVFGAQTGRTWTTELAGGGTCEWAVTRFFTDAAGRDAVELTGTAADPRAKGVTRTTTVVYARGVGEVWRAVAVAHPALGTWTAFEQRLDEVRDTGSREVAPPPR